MSGVAADSRGAKRIGAIAWGVTQRWVKESHVLPDDAIRAAQLKLWKDFKLAVEPAAAVPLAALHSGIAKDARRACLVICGANLDPATLA